MTHHKLLVYGTLRTQEPEKLTEVHGYMWDVGRFPAVKLGSYDGVTVTCEVRTVTDEELEGFDAYEGYRESDPKNSLYIRRRVTDLHDDEYWIYVWNGSTEHLEPVEPADWFEYTGQYQQQQQEVA